MDIIPVTIPLWKKNNVLISMYWYNFFWKLPDVPRRNGNKSRRCVFLSVVQGLSVLCLLFSICLSFVLLLYCAFSLLVNVMEPVRTPHNKLDRDTSRDALPPYMVEREHGLHTCLCWGQGDRARNQILHVWYRRACIPEITARIVL